VGDSGHTDEKPDVTGVDVTDLGRVPRWARSTTIRGVAAGLGLGVLAGACSAAPAPEEQLGFEGPESGELLGAADVEETALEVHAAGEHDADALDDLAVLLDGEDVTAEATRDDGVLRYPLDGLEDGPWTVTVVESHELESDADADPEPMHEWAFTIDTEPPTIELTEPDGAVVAGQELTVAGTTEPGATVAVGETSTTADEDGAFELVLDTAPEGALELSATDPAGNTSEDEMSLVTVPSRATADEIRSVHVSFCGWATPSLREPVLELIDEGLITAVQLDLKDETGYVGYDTELEMAELVGADEPHCRVDLEAAVEELHDLGVPVIGRIVAFADPVLATWAWDNGERDWVIQTSGGEKFVGKYAGFSNFAHPDIVDYNVGVAEEAAAMGVDHILWDYVRKPDGPVEQFDFVGLETTPEESIADFVRTADERLQPYGVVHGASLYGVSADRPTEVSQDVEVLADHLDYVAPMIYPSHWAKGEYDVADPLHQPRDMVEATLEVWLEATEGRRARVAPWLEDSLYPVSLGFPDRARYVREQIAGTYASGIDEWILWDSSVKYTTSAMLQPDD
jgi:hypothetical protein